MPEPKKIYGYEIRPPFASEGEYFNSNKEVTGMAAEDGKVVLNPYSSLSPEQQDAVARNEASRLFIRENNYKFDFPVTPMQLAPFQAVNSSYAKPENLHHLQSTILARIISGDPSAGDVTPEQKVWAEKIKAALEARK